MDFFKNNKRVLWFTVSVLIIGLIVIAGCGTTPAPKPAPDQNQAQKNKIIGSPGRMVIGYYENPWPNTPDTVGSLPSMKTFGKSMSAVGPFWYKATKDGQIDGKDSQLVYEQAKNMNLRMYPLLTNMPEATDSILGDAAVRTKLTDNIVKLVQEKKFDGINIDFELLPPEHRDNLNAFMKELYPKMMAINKTVIISVFPKVDVDESVSGAYDYPVLAKNADFLQIMTYDKHWSTSKPGPIAPIGWYEDNIKYAIEHCGGAHKVIVGVGAYGYNWKGTEGETVTYANAIALAEKNGVGIMYDAKVQAPHFKYGDNEVWFENAQSTEAKLNVIEKYRPAGIAVWRLGQEQPEIWQVIDKKFPKGVVAPKGAAGNATNPPANVTPPANVNPSTNVTPPANVNPSTNITPPAGVNQPINVAPAAP